MNVEEMLEEYGEVEFRDIESRVIMRIIDEGKMVMEKGGGEYMKEEKREEIEEEGI